MLTAQFLLSGNIKLPIRQLLVIWVKKAWKIVPVKLVIFSWTTCGYPSEDMIGTTNKTTIVPYSPEHTSTYWK